MEISLHDNMRVIYPANIIFKSSEDTYDGFVDVTRGTPLDFLVQTRESMGFSGKGYVSSEGSLDWTDKAYDSFLSSSAMSDGSVETSKLSSSSEYLSDVDDFGFLCGSTSVTDCSILFSSSNKITIPDMTMDILVMGEREYDEKTRNVSVTNSTTNNVEHQFQVTTLKAPILPKRQFFLEKGKTFNVAGHVSEIVSVIENVLKSAACVYSFDVKKVAWNVRCPSTQYTFTVRVFQTNEKDDMNHLIEVKRMSGCCIGFTKLYGKLHSGIMNSSLVTLTGRK